MADVQELFDAAQAQVAAGTFTRAAWLRLVADVRAATAGEDLELVAVHASAAAQLGADLGYGPEEGA